MVKYLGSKRLLLDDIAAIVASKPGVRRVLDLFSGTSRVGHRLKREGFHVIANDHNAYAHTLATCYVQADRNLWADRAQTIIDELNLLPGRAGYVTETFCEKARYFQPKNGERIDAIRSRIAELGADPELEAVLLTSLIEAADRVDSTTGVQMAYLKQWSARSHDDLRLRLPDLLPGPGEAHRREAAEAASLPADLAYLDPPYNQHSYLGNYHVWETIVRGDAPEAYGTAQKRLDCRDRKSDFNSRVGFASAVRKVLGELRAQTVVVSFSNEGFVTFDEMMAMLSELGRVTVEEKDYRRYVGAQIGIHNPSGEKVGKVSHLRNREYLFVCDRT